MIGFDKATLSERSAALGHLGPIWTCAQIAATALFNRPLARLRLSAVLPPGSRGRSGTGLIAHVSYLAVSLAGAQAFGQGHTGPRRVGGAQGRSGFKGVGAHAARLGIRMVRASLPAERVGRLRPLRSPRTRAAIETRARVPERFDRSPNDARAEGFVVGPRGSAAGRRAAAPVGQSSETSRGGALSRRRPPLLSYLHARGIRPPAAAKGRRARFPCGPGVVRKGSEGVKPLQSRQVLLQES
jgi:hypothetical protein